MKKYETEFSILSESLLKFEEILISKKSSLRATNEWSVKDILCHIVFWHEIYAANCLSQVKETDFELPEKMSTINIRGVNKLKAYSRSALLERLHRAHLSLQSSIVDFGIKSMIYSKGGRTYETGEFLKMIAAHIWRHAIQMRRASLSKSMRRAIKPQVR